MSAPRSLCSPPAATPGKGPGKDLGDFSGEPVSNMWRLCVGDVAFADKGTFESVTLTVVL